MSKTICPESERLGAGTSEYPPGKCRLEHEDGIGRSGCAHEGWHEHTADCKNPCRRTGGVDGTTCTVSYE